MKEKILEVQNYFINKITACEFDLEKIKKASNDWWNFTVKIDGYAFEFSVKLKHDLFCFFSGFIEVKVPRDRLQNLIKLIETHKEEAKAEKIQKLKAELAELEN